ncbi:hypothetical protein J2S77_000780 [Alkalibacillus salilacus]|uniref:Uncharacterized protein n=1 Tax=Alkalibacillus salilacus TaxID=284582 RepID=A0ABT9VD47_9BACI|nr:hypothetical protein [Alkalibacillus salilacus]
MIRLFEAITHNISNGIEKGWDFIVAHDKWVYGLMILTIVITMIIKVLN